MVSSMITRGTGCRTVKMGSATLQNLIIDGIIVVTDDECNCPFGIFRRSIIITQANLSLETIIDIIKFMMISSALTKISKSAVIFFSLNFQKFTEFYFNVMFPHLDRTPFPINVPNFILIHFRLLKSETFPSLLPL